MIKARADHIDAVISSVLVRNKAKRQSPKSYAELADQLNRNTVNLWRWRAGNTEPTVSDMQSLALLLQVPVAELF